MEVEVVCDMYSPDGPYNEELVGVYQIERGEEINEPYTWGETRGVDVFTRATLVYLKFNNAKIDRGLAIRMYGKAAVLSAEHFVEENGYGY